MEFTFNKHTLLPLITLLLTACGSGQTSSTSTETSSLLEDDKTEVEVVTKYDGAYQTFCGVSTFAPLSDTSVSVTTLDGDAGTIVIYNYLDKGCTLPATPNQTIMKLSLSYPGESIETNRGEADFVDITVESVTLDGQAPSLAEQQLLASSSLLGTRYDIIVLQDSALYTGETSENLTGTTEETRPITLNSHPSIEQ